MSAQIRSAGRLKSSELNGTHQSDVFVQPPFFADRIGPAGSPPVAEEAAQVNKLVSAKPGTQDNNKIGRTSRGGRAQRTSSSEIAAQTLYDMPMPKWPANWITEAFEAVAQKKSLILSPPEIYAEVVHKGEEKLKNYTWYQMLLLTSVAGMYVGFGATLAFMVGGMMNESPVGPISERNIGVFRVVFGTFGFPFAFTTIVVCGGELYTSFCTYMTAAALEGKISFASGNMVTVLSWFGNLAGCLVMAGLLHASGIYKGREKYAIYVATDKLHHTWIEVFIRGIFANWLVGIATLMANAAQDLTGKFVGIFLPISAFAMFGFEHCVANQFILPMGKLLGADISVPHIIQRNLIPATLGNWVGGAICVAGIYAFTYGRTPLLLSKLWHEKVRTHKLK